MHETVDINHPPEIRAEAAAKATVAAFAASEGHAHPRVIELPKVLLIRILGNVLLIIRVLSNILLIHIRVLLIVDTYQQREHVTVDHGMALLILIQDLYCRYVVF